MKKSGITGILLCRIGAVMVLSLAVNGQSRPAPSVDSRSVLTGETMREMSKADRVSGDPSPTNTGKPAVSLKLKEDFKRLQQINNQMMATVWAHDRVDYQSAYKMLTTINEIAIRLKKNLALPPLSKSDSNAIPDPTADREFRAALLVMDESLTGFVKNPVFQSRGLIDADAPVRASTLLDNVIRMSRALKSAAARMNVSADKQ